MRHLKSAMPLENGNIEGVKAPVDDKKYAHKKKLLKTFTNQFERDKRENNKAEAIVERSC